MNFDNKVAVVSGGANGIGRATAIRLASNGAKVVIADIAKDDADAVVASIADAGGEATAIKTDSSKSDNVRQTVTTAIETYGAIHYLVNSVGIQTYGTVATTDEDLWDHTLNVNLKSVYLMSHYCVPKIIKQGGGAIVNVASVQGYNSSQQNVAAYATSKAGVIALSRSMSLDHAPDKIRVNCVLPGSVDTPLLRAGASTFAVDGDVQAVIDSWGEFHPIGRVGQPDEIAQMITFLLSDAASFVTGATITADGGLTTKLI